LQLTFLPIHCKCPFINLMQLCSCQSTAASLLPIHCCYFITKELLLPCYQSTTAFSFDNQSTAAFHLLILWSFSFTNLLKLLNNKSTTASLLSILCSFYITIHCSLYKSYPLQHSFY
jgi:DMSO/TMAO reductase YedYZ heme-binding membrane subunit